MNGFVIDTNVLLVADRQHPQAGPECELNCVTFLNDIRNNKVVYLDDDDHIFGEYRKGLKSGSQQSRRINLKGEARKRSIELVACPI